MDLCDTLGVDYVFGLPTNSRVRKHVKTRVADTEKRYEQHYAGTGKKMRQFDTCTYGAHSWGAKNAASLRFIVTSLSGHRSKYLYEKIYCARGQAENCIKSWKRHLASDRTSCSKANANQMRLGGVLIILLTLPLFLIHFKKIAGRRTAWHVQT